MKKILLCYCFILALFPAFTLADEPPDWRAFLIHSANNKWTAYLYPESTSDEPWKDKWHLKVFNKNFAAFPDAKEKTVWSRDFKPTGYPEGLLSDDGQVFAHISFWYVHRYPLITIYRNECKQEHYANSLGLPKNMPATASHQIWLDQKKNNHFIEKDGKLMLEVFTLNGIRLISTECKGK